MRRILVLLAAAVTSCGGCHKKSTAGPSDGGDASADASTIAVTGPFTGRLLARSMTQTFLYPLEGGAMMVAAGLYVYAVESDGLLRRVGAPADYAVFLPEGDQDLGGYEAHPTPMWTGQLSGTVARPFVQRGHPAQTMVWDGHTWTKTAEAAPPAGERFGFTPRTVRERDAGPAPGANLLPKDHEWREPTKLADGRTVWLGAARDPRHDVAFIADANGANGVLTMPLARREGDAGAETRVSCRPLPSVDGRTYLHCDVDGPNGERFEHIQHVLRLDGAAWTELALPPADTKNNRNGFAVDAGGGLWFAEGYEPQKLVRMDKDGRAETVAMPPIDAALARPSYDVDLVVAKAARDDAPSRQWSAVRIVDGEPPGERRWLSEILPRPNGEVFIVGRDKANAWHVVRFARGVSVSSSPAVAVLGSAGDIQNEIHNTRPPRPWVGHCPQIFVTLASAPVDAGFDAAGVLRRESDVDSAIRNVGHPARKPEPSMDAALVEGRLGDRHVVGVVFLRGYPDTNEEELEAAANRVIERFTASPTTPPEASCSVPTLERLHKSYRWAI